MKRFMLASGLVTVLLAVPALAQNPKDCGGGACEAVPAPSAEDGHWAVYEDPEIFEQLSGAARSMLEARFEGAPGEWPTPEGIAPGVSPQRAADAVGAAFQALSAVGTTLVNDPSADATARKTQSETTLVLGSGQEIVAGFNDSGSFVGGASKFTGFSRSTDMGATWTDGGTLPTNLNGDAGDPVLARNDATGRIYFSTLQFSGNGLRVFRSDDGGQTWMAPTQGVPGATGFQDKEWMAVDNFLGSGQGNVYLAYRDFASSGGGIRFTRSTDNGDTFGPSPRGLLIKAGSPSNVQGAWVTVGPDHAVYVFWYDQNFTPRQIRMRKSTDQGMTFGAEISVATLVGTATNGGLGLNGGFRSNSFPQALVNPTDASKIYVVYNDVTAVVGGDRGNIYFRQSINGGTTWGAAVQLNTDATTRDQFFPAIGVKPDGSGLSVHWYDRRRDPANSLIERWGIIATITGSTVTFGPEFRIGPAFPPVFGLDPVVNVTYMGDYDQVVADNSFYYGTFLDTSPVSGQDVRFAKVPADGPGAILDFGSYAISGGDGAIDVNECNVLSVTLQNNGSATATGIVGTLSTTTPGVTITQDVAVWPDIAPGASAANLTPFRVSTSAAFVCGTAIELTLTLNSGEVLNFNPASGSPDAPISYDAAGLPLPIPDLSTIDSPLTVAGFPGAVAKATASLHLTHSFDDDLILSLIGPDSTTVTLSNRRGGADDNYGTSCDARTTFDDAAATSIASGTAPFAGTFRPEGALSAFNGKSGLDVDGTWRLRISDSAALDVGSLQCWTLNLSPFVCTDGGGTCADVCVRTPGYWKNHASAWPVTSLTLGTVSYTQAQLLSILNQPVKGTGKRAKANGLVSLAHQLIAARLNLENGATATPQVIQAIADANALIGGLVIPPVGGGSLQPATTSALTAILDMYNRGVAPGGPSTCERDDDDEERRRRDDDRRR